MNQPIDEGILAYKSGDFETAIELLQSTTASDPNNWNAKFYLAMCLTRVNRFKEAKFHFASIRDVCPDAELRQRATTAYSALP